jgi:hypothetical protein
MLPSYDLLDAISGMLQAKTRQSDRAAQPDQFH